MKNKIATLLLALAGISAPLASRADVVWQELFPYPDGVLTNVAAIYYGGNQQWFVHSGSGLTTGAAFVKGHRLENASSSATLFTPRQDDVHRFFTSVTNGANIYSVTNSETILYVGFVVNCTNPPTPNGGGYFAHFYVNSTTFEGKLFATGTNSILPNTWRLGVSGTANFPNQIFPVDLATNQDYQVVMEWDPVNLYALSLWVSPVSSSDVSVISSDTFTPQVATGIAFRQASGMANWFGTISNVVVATTFDDAATNVWAYNSVNPSIAYPLQAVTNYVGVPAQLSIVAAGQGLASFTYQWQKNGANISNPNGNSNILSFASPALSDTGNYGVIVSNLVTGASATNPAVLMWVTNGPPLIAVQPVSSTNYQGKNVSISVTAYGTPALVYSWTYNGGPATNADSSTTNTATLVIPNVQTNNNTVGSYRCAITNAYGGTNTVSVTLSVIAPPIVNIDALHSFVDPTFFLPTNTALYYTVTNAVVYTREVTNGDGSVNGGPFTGSANGEFYIQDSSGGICVFVAGGTTQPRQGDIVTVTGPLSQFSSLLEFNLSTADPSTSVTVTGHTNTLPTPVVLPFTFTNGSGGFISVSNVIRHYEGRYVTLTNVYFPGSAVGGAFASGTYYITNLSGDTFSFFLNAANVNIIGQTVPQFARTVSGAMGYFNGTTATNRSSGFEIDPFSFSDIVAGPNPPTGVIAVTSGGVPTINWQAQPFVPYSVLWATNVIGPYVPVATGLIFTTAAGTFTDMVNTNLPASFYKISSP